MRAAEEQRVNIERTGTEVPSVKSLAEVYRLAVRRDDQFTAQAAEQAVLSLGRAEAAIAESTVLASFLNEV